MKIPKSFKVAGKTYEVRLDCDKRLLEQKIVGQCSYPSCTIKLNCFSDNIKQSKECVQHTYLHEVWHAIWNALGEDELRSDERRANAFSELLLQVLNSGIGEIKY